MDTWTVIIQMDMWTSKAKSFHVSHCYKRIHQTRNSENGTNKKKKKKQNLKRELNSGLSNLMVMLLLQALMIDINVQLWTIKYDRVHQLTACI